MFIDQIDEYYNKADNFTAVCRTNISHARGEYPELEIGKTYHVTHYGIFRSFANVILAEFPGKEYIDSCFDLYENGEPYKPKHQMARKHIIDVRFWAPYLRRMWGHDFPERLEKSMTNATIPNHIESIEKECNVKVLLAVEAGSRAWGFESRNSDWDVRFIYVHKPEWYFRVEEQRDVIERMYDDDVDLAGWELRKALTLLHRSNPSLLEWLNSPIIYYIDEEFAERIRDIANDCINPIRLMYHYQHIYCKHDEKYLQKEGYPMKRFLYYLRGVLACKWIEQHQTLPPVPFKELLDATVEDSEMRRLIDELIRIKRGEEEQDITIVDDRLVAYARTLADHYTQIANSFRPEIPHTPADKLDQLLYDMVQKYA